MYTYYGLGDWLSVYDIVQEASDRPPHHALAEHFYEDMDADRANTTASYWAVNTSIFLLDKSHPALTLGWECTWAED